MARGLKDALIVALLASILALPFAGVRTTEGLNGLVLEWHFKEIIIVFVLAFLFKFLLNSFDRYDSKRVLPFLVLGLLALLWVPFPTLFLKFVSVSFETALIVKCSYFLVRKFIKTSGWDVRCANLKLYSSFKSQVIRYDKISLILFGIAILFPFTPLASRYSLDVAIMVLTYVMLASGLNLTVGYAGILDLGYAGFYALGAYTYALLALHFQLNFWLALPFTALVTAFTAFILGLPVLRLRGDYFAVVTLGFGEIVRLVLINWTNLTGGPNGITGVPRPKLLGLEFSRESNDGAALFHDFFGIPFNPIHRVVFLYMIILVLAAAVGFLSSKLRKTPLGRSWEAFREDEIACAALGINRWKIKLAAYCLSAGVAGMAGTFFSARQGFVSPESFTFTESATMLAIVILGGIGHPLGIVLAASFIIGLPELFRDLEQYRMLAFGAGLVLIMISRPGGMMAKRDPTIDLNGRGIVIP